MNPTTLRNFFLLPAVAMSAVGLSIWSQSRYTPLEASSHREAPLIADDPLADNTDVYAFRAPNDPNRVVLIANYIPFELPHGGPNYYTFGENVRYEVHVKNRSNTPGDDITYRFTFAQTNQDPTTFFNIRLNQQNLKTTYTCEKSTNGGASFSPIVTGGIVPPNNIGPRSIESAVGLSAPNYESLRTSAIANATGAAAGGEQIYCGPADDPFFADLGAIFDLAGLRPTSATDGLAKKNVHSICLSVPIATLSKTGTNTPANILDSDYVIGVWASASRQQIRTLSAAGGEGYSGNYVQVSRLGMPLTNEVINPIGAKDRWNSRTPYQEDVATDGYLSNPELDLYVGEGAFAGAVPALAALDLQGSSLNGFPGIPAGGFNFNTTGQGLFPIKGSALVAGTALDDAAFGNYLLVANNPRSVDIKPIFHTGVPNLIPYQLATGKTPGNPLTAGKPFINNFLPLAAPGVTNPGGDMLRLNMAVPATPRNSPDFSNDGLIAAAAAGLLNPTYNGSAALQSIPNMDGFPNGRRLEDAVDKIELKAIGGLVLAAIGLGYDDYTPASPSLATPKLVAAATFTSGLEVNDTTSRAAFPYVQTPWRGTGQAGGPTDILPVQDISVRDARTVAPGTYRNIDVTSSGAATVATGVVVTGRLTVAAGGVLDLDQPLTGTGSVVIAAGATLRIAEPGGLSAAGITMTGALRNSGGRTLSTDATYIYDGTVAQGTGAGLPPIVRGIGVANSAGVTLSQNLSVRQLVNLIGGDLLLNGRSLVLLSNAASTAMVVNGDGVVVGTATVQRYINPSSNPNRGYRHLSSPTTASPVSDLTTSGFTPIVDPDYNAIPLVKSYTFDNFPNVFGYNEQRAPTSGDFFTGYFSPNTLGDLLIPGRGYAVSMRGGLTPDFVGNLTQTDLTIPNLTKTGNFTANNEKSGWHLLGNCFPSPLDWDLVTIPSGLSGSISVFKSTGLNDGIYQTRVNGVGTLEDGILPLGQAFFSRVVGAGPVSLTLPNAARPTDYVYANQQHFRSASTDTRPAVSLTLRRNGVTNPATDETLLYFQTGATAGVDRLLDGAKPGRNIGAVPTLVSLTTANEELSVNALPASALTTGTLVPLLASVPVTGSYTIALKQWANLTGTDVVLIDRLLNIRTPITPGASYTFQAQAGVTATRFVVAFGPAASVLGTGVLTSGSALVVWPNPAHDQVQIGGTAPHAALVVMDATGRTVLLAKADATGTARLDLTRLTKGVYIVKVGAESRRLTVE